MARKVLLPRNLERRLDNLTGLNEEINGILLYRKQDSYCPIEEIFITGVGSVGHVEAQPERIEIANEFFRRNPDYQFVKFHTHSKETIKIFGQYYARHFSQGDINGIEEQLKYNREFMAMLVTPEIKLLSGIDNSGLFIVNDFQIYKDRNQAVSLSLKVIARNLGYDISKLQAKRR